MTPVLCGAPTAKRAGTSAGRAAPDPADVRRLCAGSAVNPQGVAAPCGLAPARLVAAFGGESNIKSLDACITRLRMELVDNARANPDALRALGASGVMVVPGGMQAIFGTRSENLKTDMEEYMKSSGAAVAVPTSAPISAKPAASANHAPLTPELRARARAIVAALGGAKNIVQADLIALTRLRVELRNADHISDAELTKAGALGAWRVSPNIVHVIVGEDAPELAAAVAESRSGLAATATVAK